MASTEFVNLQLEQPWDVIEFFAGVCQIARHAKDQGWNAAAVDLNYDAIRAESRRSRVDGRSPFDLNSDSGLALLASMIVHRL